MRFCPSCGAPATYRVPEGDDRKRACCTSCEEIHYENPKVVVGTLPLFADGRILLCKRAIEPRYGLWTLPAGFMENGETLREGAARETWEEAKAKVTELRMFTSVSLPQINQIYHIFIGDVENDVHAPGPESLDTKAVDYDSIPWSELAFPVMRMSLERLVEHGRDAPAFETDLVWKRSTKTTAST